MGTIQFTVSGVKDRGYNYIIRNAANATIQNANNVKPLQQLMFLLHNPCRYTITVTDRKTLCSDDYSITLTQPTALTITSATATNVFCSNFQFTNYGFSYGEPLIILCAVRSLRQLTPAPA
jgi:hypothetical protein